MMPTVKDRPVKFTGDGMGMNTDLMGNILDMCPDWRAHNMEAQH